MTPTEFGERIRKIRTSKNIKQVEVAKRANIALNTYRNWENGLHIPRRDFMPKLAEALEVTEDALFVDPEKLQINNFSKATQLTSQLVALFAGGNLTDKDKDALMLTLQQAYLSSKNLSFPDENAEIWQDFDPTKGGVSI